MPSASASDYIRHGLADIAIVGASESVINYGVMRAWQAMHVLSPEGCFPFAKKRNGTVLAEGAGMLVLESMAHAKGRGAKILAELCGFGMTSDSKDMVNPDIDGPSEAMRLALEDAELAPDRHRLPQRPRHRHHHQRPQRDQRHQARVRQARLQPGGVLHQVDARPSAGRRRRHRGGGLRQGHGGQLGAAHHRPRPRPIPSATSTTCPTWAATKEVTYAMSNSFAFGGLNAVLVFGPPPA